MRDDLVLEGAIPPGGIVELLADIEATCVTGVLRFESALEGSGSVALVRGQFAQEQTLDREGRDPVEVLLTLREGRFSLAQRLPVLPVSSGDERVKTGSLAVHVPSELMRYCELAGLTGRLYLSRPPELVELCYERGELAEVRVGGSEGSGTLEFEEVFAWSEGRFTVEAKRYSTRALESQPAFPPSEPAALRPAQSPDERMARSTTQDLGGSTEASFLRVVEMSLEELLRERVERTPRARTGPVIPSLPPARSAQRPLSTPPPEPPSEPVRTDCTVKVIYLAAQRSPGDEDRRPPMDLNVPLPGEGARVLKPDLPRVPAISALDDAGRVRQSQLPDKARGPREDEVTTQFDTASHAAQDIARDRTMLAEYERSRDDILTEAPPGRAHPMTEENKQDDTAATGDTPADPPVATGPLTTLKWVGFACLVLITCLAVLARLPPID